MFLQSLNVLKFLRKNHSPSPQIIYLSNLILIWELKDILLRIHIPKLSACHEATPETIVKYRNEVERRLLN